MLIGQAKARAHAHAYDMRNNSSVMIIPATHPQMHTFARIYFLSFLFSFFLIFSHFSFFFFHVLVGAAGGNRHAACEHIAGSH